MPDDSGWTHVKRKTRRSNKNNNITSANAASQKKTTLPDTFAPRTTGILRSPDVDNEIEVHVPLYASSARRIVGMLESV